MKNLNCIVYDSRGKNGTTKGFAEKLSNSLGLNLYHIDDYNNKYGSYILITYTIGLGEVPRKTISFLNNHSFNMKGVISNGSSNFKVMGLFALAGVTISREYNVPLYKKLDLGGSTEDVYYTATRLNYDFKLNVKLDKKDYIPLSTYIKGRFNFKSRH